MKKFILAIACVFALGTSLSAQNPEKRDSVKKETSAKSDATKSTDKAGKKTCCSAGAKSCDCKAGAACEKDGKKTCRNAQPATKCDKKDGDKKQCCKKEAQGKEAAKCDKKDGAKKECCKKDAKSECSKK